MKGLACGLWLVGQVGYNLALEEALLQLSEEGRLPPLLWLWINPPSVIVGLSTPIREFVNIAYCRSKGISLGRRISGGGAVYQDHNNLNWSLIAPKHWFGTSSPLELYARAADLLIGLLGRLGLRLTFGAPNRLDMEGHKVGGIAAYLKTRSALIHGTLMVNVDLACLRQAIAKHTSPLPLANVNGGWTAPELAKELSRRCQLEGLEPFTPSDEAHQKAARLREEKYDREEWIFRL